MYKALLLVLLSGCASQECYFEIGLGGFTNSDGHTNKTPTTGDLYCEKGDFKYGLFHQSDLLRGQPFNNQEELSITTIMVKYRTRIGD